MEPISLDRPRNEGAVFDRAIANDIRSLPTVGDIIGPEPPEDVFQVAQLSDVSTGPEPAPQGLGFVTTMNFLDALQQGSLSMMVDEIPGTDPEETKLGRAAQVFKESMATPGAFDVPFDLALQIAGTDNPNATAALATGLKLFATPETPVLAGMGLIKHGLNSVKAARQARKGGPLSDVFDRMHKDIPNEDVRRHLDFLSSEIRNGNPSAMQEYDAIISNNPTLFMKVDRKDARSTVEYLSSFNTPNSAKIKAEMRFADELSQQRKIGSPELFLSETNTAPVGRAGVFATRYLDINQPVDVDRLVSNYQVEAGVYVKNTPVSPEVEWALKTQPSKLAVDIGDVLKLDVDPSQALGYRLLLADISQAMKKSFSPTDYSFASHASRVRFYKLFGLREQLIANLTMTPRDGTKALYRLNTAGPKFIQGIKLKESATRLAPQIGAADQARILGRTKLNQSEMFGKSILDMETTDELNAFLNRAAMPDDQWGTIKKNIGIGADKLHYAWITGLLSNPLTHVVNNVSNAWTHLVDPLVKDVGGAAVHLVKGHGEQALGQLKAQMAYQRALWQSVPDAFRVLIRHPNRTPSDMMTWSGQHEVANFSRATLTPQALEQAGTLRRGYEMLAPFFPVEMLGKQDAFWRTMGYQAEKSRQAYLAAFDVAPTPESIGTFYRKFKADPLFEMEHTSFSKARERVFQAPPGPLGQSAIDVVNMTPGLRWVIPFKVTPVNLVKYNFAHYTPLQVFSRSFRDDVAAGGARRAGAYGRLALSSSIFGYGVANLPLDRVTGSKPVGSIPRYSYLNSEGEWVDYSKIESLRIILGTIANLATVNAFSDWDAMDSTERAGELSKGAIMSFGRPLLDNNWVLVAGETLVAVDDIVNRSESRRLEQMAQQFGGSAGTPGLRRFLNTDPHVYDYVGVVEKVLNEWGFNENSPYKTDLFGNPILNPVHSMTPMRARPGTNQDDIYKQMGQVGFIPRDVVRDLRGVELTAAQRARLRSLRAMPEGVPPLEETLRAGMRSDTYLSGDKEAKRLFISSIVTGYGRVATEQLIAQDPELAAMIREMAR